MNNYSIQDIKNLITKTLIDKKIPNEFLMNKWQEQSQHSNNSMHLYYHLFFRIAMDLQPAFTVELGGWRGLAAGCFAGGNELGTVITIDHHGDPGDDAHRIEMIKMESHFSNMHYLQGWTTPGYAEEYGKGRSVYQDVVELLNGRKISIMFLDSWHEGRYLLRDWEYYYPLLDKNALVIVDDIFDSNLFIGMLDAWNSLPGEKFIDKEMHSGIPMGFIKLG